MTFWTVAAALILLCGACSPQKPQTPEIASISPLISAIEQAAHEPFPTEDKPDAGNPNYRPAKEFQDLLLDQSPADSQKALIRHCKLRPQYSPFCFSILQIKTLKAKLHASDHTPTKLTPSEVTAVAPIFSRGRVVNWRQLRRANPDNLLKGLAQLDLPTLDKIRVKASGERFCPNNIGVAVAATLEDYLPDQVSPVDIGAIYEKCARCFHRGTANREHFLTRAGLMFYLAKDYERAARILRMVDPVDAYVGRAPYWLYRSYLKLGEKQHAQKTVQRLISHYPLSFHALITMVAQGTKPEQAFVQSPRAQKTRSVKSPSTNKILTQIEILHQAGLEETAHLLAEWAGTSRQPIEPEVRLYLANLGSNQFKVSSLSDLFMRRKEFISRPALEAAYPRPYLAAFEKNRFGLDPLLLLAIARKESRLDRKATSVANAQGLLQINPDTAQKLVPGIRLNLYDPRVNIPMGAYYLSKVLKDTNGNLPWALATYNAGQTATQSWIKRFSKLEPLLQIDLITFRETRNYVGMVLTNYYWYQYLYGSETKNVLEGLIERTN